MVRPIAAVVALAAWKDDVLIVLDENGRVHQVGASGDVLPVSAGVFSEGTALVCTASGFATGHADGVVRVFAMDGGLRAELRGHRGAILALDGDDAELVSGSADGTAIVWDLAP